MSVGRVLIIEPYPALADVLEMHFQELGYAVTIASAPGPDQATLENGGFDCVFINLDQRHGAWTDTGLRFAEAAKRAGLPVVMIPDTAQAQAVLDTRGWIQLHKPFTLKSLRDAVSQATGHDLAHG